MKTLAQKINSNDDTLEILPRTILEKLAANITELTATDISLSEDANLAIRKKETDHGL